jgi:LmbE family N-acetylglucosaminyl deacetylase
MKLTKPTADVFIPDGLETEAALARTTHLSVGAHADDCEIMAVDGILKCFSRDDRWFTAVTLTNGAGSARTGTYARYSHDDMIEVRRREQRKAAVIGEYAAALQLDYESAEVKDPAGAGPVADLAAILAATRPEVLYTHNPADKHDTHVATMLRVLAVLRAMPRNERPAEFYGFEVWRDLDWMVDSDKVAFDVSKHENVSAALIAVHDSQISGGKRYDLASLGRRKANATYYASHGIDAASLLIYGVDLKPLIDEDDLSVTDFIDEKIDRFRDEVNGKIRTLSP